MTTLPDVLARVDDEQLHVVWVTDTRARARELVEWIRHHHQTPAGTVTVSVGREGYRHIDGGWLRIIPMTAPAAVRGLTADLLVLPEGVTIGKGLTDWHLCVAAGGEIASW